MRPDNNKDNEGFYIWFAAAIINLLPIIFGMEW